MRYRLYRSYDAESGLELTRALLLTAPSIPVNLRALPEGTAMNDQLPPPASDPIDWTDCPLARRYRLPGEKRQ